MLLSAAGCALPTQKHKGAADTAIKDFRESLDTFDDRVESSVRSIDRLQNTVTFDVQRAYMDFMTEYFNVTADAAAVGEQAEVMRDTGVDYFVVARKESKAGKNDMKEEDLTQRETAVRAEYDTLQARLGELSEAYRVYRQQLNGAYKYLNRNVSRQRVATASPQLLAAREQAGVVRQAIAATKRKPTSSPPWLR